MALQYSATLYHARLDLIESTLTTTANLAIRSGTLPANCAAANAGTVLATVPLTSDWMAAAAAGAKSKSGTWQDTSADNPGTATHFRMYTTAADTGVCHVQGTVGVGTGDLQVDSTTFASGQAFTINSFTITTANQ